MNPYDNLPSNAFWKFAVANRSMFDIEEFWSPKFDIQPNQKVATYGSCFAQHIGKALAGRGFDWLITEQAPFGCSVELAKKYNYGVFTARTGNIYTTSLLRQWTEWALGKKAVPIEVWEKEGRFYDPFRPRIEPNGFESEHELKISQNQAIKAFRESIEQSEYFVYTLGLTESWFNDELGYEYPMCPGTVAGDFDESKHKFVNQQFQFVLKNLSLAIGYMREVNPKLRFLLTVSPVPLVATNSQKHVVVATMASKSVLRAVTEQLSVNRENVDYFPSYEIINSPIFKGVFFEPNLRSVNPYGVNFVMDIFFQCLHTKYGLNHSTQNELTCMKQGCELKSNEHDIDEHCEEALLEAFGGGNEKNSSLG